MSKKRKRPSRVLGTPGKPPDFGLAISRLRETQNDQEAMDWLKRMFGPVLEYVGERSGRTPEEVAESTAAMLSSGEMRLVRHPDDPEDNHRVGLEIRTPFGWAPVSVPESPESAERAVALEQALEAALLDGDPPAP